MINLLPGPCPNSCPAPRRAPFPTTSPLPMLARTLACLAALAALQAGWRTSPAPAAEPDRPPNVVIIFTDDQGAVDLGCYGSDDLLTPHVDALAERGVRFTQFYAAAPVCSPSRAGLLTGRHPVRASQPGNAPSIPGQPGMPAEQVTMAEIFRDAGYATALIGKWHLGYTPETGPNQQGFDYTFGHMGGCIDNYSHFFYWSGPNRHDLHRNGEPVHYPGRYFPDLMVEESIRFIDDHADRPFLLYFASNAPHYPYQGDPEWLEHYDQAGVKYPRNLYNAFLTSLDVRIGQLLDHLDQRGLTEHTIVVFQSDHGHSVEERAHHGGGSAGPYRGHKFTMFEGGLRVPAIISWPGKLPQDEARDQLAHGCDWLPTLAALAGVELPDLGLDGRDLTGVILEHDAPSPHQTLHWQTGRGNNATWAVRDGPWKLLGKGEGEQRHSELMLFNLEIDVAESECLLEPHPDAGQRLRGLRLQWEADHL